MDGQSGFINFGSEQLHYLKWGSGKNLLIALHGYGNNANLFQPLSASLQEKYTLISIDLPHHGQSKWPLNLPFSHQHIQALLNQLLQQYQVQQLSLLAYSIGGRMALYMACFFPNAINKVVLLAPDGLVFNPFYYFVTRNFIGKALFRSFLQNPKPYTNLITLFSKLHIITEARYKFGMQYLQTPVSREFLYQVWPAMANIVPNQHKLIAILRKHNIPVHIFIGKYDKVIPLSQAKTFQRNLPFVHIHVLDKGHRLLDNETVNLIAQCLL